MPNDIAITLRLPGELLERASAIIEYLESEVLTSARVSRSTAIRHALERGLSELEEDAALRAHQRQAISDELALGEPPEDVAAKYRRYGFRLSDILKIAAGVEVVDLTVDLAPKPKAKKKRKKKSR